MVKYGIARLDRGASSILTNGAALYKTCVKPNVYVSLIAILASVQNLYDRSLHMLVCMIAACFCLYDRCLRRREHDPDIAIPDADRL